MNGNRILKIWRGNTYIIPSIITEDYLDSHPEFFFVFGDNTLRMGRGGAASLRYHPQAIGFITKRCPDNSDCSFYTPEDYMNIFPNECELLENRILSNPDNLFLISEIGGGLANRYHIYEIVIQPWLQSLKYENIVLL